MAYACSLASEERERRPSSGDEPLEGWDKKWRVMNDATRKATRVLGVRVRATPVCFEVIRSCACVGLNPTRCL